MCNCVCKVNFTVRQTIHIAIGGEIHIYTYRCEKDKDSLRIQKALSLRMINLTYIRIYEHVFAWYCVENICILYMYQKLKFSNLLMVHRLPSFLCI